jgi:hypothetical protein
MEFFYFFLSKPTKNLLIKLKTSTIKRRHLKQILRHKLSHASGEK